jgi:hypothetical protein
METVLTRSLQPETSRCGNGTSAFLAVNRQRVVSGSGEVSTTLRPAPRDTHRKGQRFDPAARTDRLFRTRFCRQCGQDVRAGIPPQPLRPVADRPQDPVPHPPRQFRQRPCHPDRRPQPPRPRPACPDLERPNFARPASRALGCRQRRPPGRALPPPLRPKIRAPLQARGLAAKSLPSMRMVRSQVLDGDTTLQSRMPNPACKMSPTARSSRSTAPLTDEGALSRCAAPAETGHRTAAAL